MAGGARLEAANLDLGLCAEDRVFEIDGQVEAQIVAALLPRLALLPAAHVEHLAEQVAEDVAKVHGCPRTRQIRPVLRPLTPA